jgi:hypothetical protein
MLITKCIVPFCKFTNASKNDLLRRQFDLKGEENCMLVSLTDCTLHENDCAHQLRNLKLGFSWLKIRFIGELLSVGQCTVPSCNKNNLKAELITF